MIPDKLGQKLHDRAARDEYLSADELAQLEVWYSAQDLAEQAYLGTKGNATDAIALRVDIASALARLETLTSQVRIIANENEHLRSENSVLRRQVAMQLEMA